MKILREASAAKREDTSLQGIAKRFMGKLIFPFLLLFYRRIIMPKKPLKPCSYPGCPNLTEGRYCEEHKKLREKQYNKYHRDKVVQSIYNSKEWKMLRRKKLELNPECEQCLREDRITRATMVDHIVPIKKGGGVFSMSNLQSLCWNCHSRKSAKEGSRWKNI